MALQANSSFYQTFGSFTFLRRINTSRSSREKSRGSSRLWTNSRPWKSWRRRTLQQPVERSLKQKRRLRKSERQKSGLKK